MRRIALVCGNGLSIDRANHAADWLDPSSPFDWPVQTPGKNSLLLDDLPALRDWIAEHRSNNVERHYDIITALTARSQGKEGPWEWGQRESAVHSELRHFLALSYAWFQLEIDQAAVEHWPWHIWFLKWGKALAAALSFNYDLILERLLYWSGIPYCYPGSRGEIITRGTRRAPTSRKAVLLSKPHGSCNFGSYLRLSPVGYPLPTHTWGASGVPIRVLQDDELLVTRDIVDIVAPGEWNALAPYLDWNRKMATAFKTGSAKANTLLVVGFSYAPCDRPEVDALFQGLPRMEEVILADPSPSTALLDRLSSLGDKVTVWSDGPPTEGHDLAA